MVFARPVVAGGKQKCQANDGNTSPCNHDCAGRSLRSSQAQYKISQEVQAQRPESLQRESTVIHHCKSAKNEFAQAAGAHRSRNLAMPMVSTVATRTPARDCRPRKRGKFDLEQNLVFPSSPSRGPLSLTAAFHNC